MGRLGDLAGRIADRTVGHRAEPGTATGRDAADGSDALDVATRIAEDPRTVTLRDGRRLGYAECGDPAGDPLVLCHGFPNSRVFGAPSDESAARRGCASSPRTGRGWVSPTPTRTGH